MNYITLRKQAIEKDFTHLNPMQREAVLKTEGPLLILAGAGSGKTTVLVSRIANIIKYGEEAHSERPLTQEAAAFLSDYAQGKSADAERARDLLAINPAKPWRIMAITFTNKAAGELKERLNAMLGEEAGGDIWAATFHASCARMLRKDAARLGYSSHFTVYDTDDQRRLMKDVQAALRIDDKIFPHRLILSEVSHAKDSLKTPEDYLNEAGSDPRRINIGKAYALYQRKLKEADAMDFDDLLVNAVTLLQNHADVLEYYQNKFRYIMVDEYQDTNHAQYVYIKLLASAHNNLCVVGDDDQSIYKFRGATIENILNFEEHYSNARVIRLEQNYRSTQNILDAANSVIKNNQGRKSKSLWTQNGEGEKVKLHTADNQEAEAEYIADKVLEDVKAGMKYSGHAILYRMNAQSNAIENMFVRSGIPYRIIGGHRFYERKEIRDMIAYLSVLNNPYDDVRLRRIINVPKRGIGEKTISTAYDIAAGLNIGAYEVLRTADEFEALSRAYGKIKPFTLMMDELLERADAEPSSLHSLYELLLDKTGYINALKAEDEDNEDRIENINELGSNLLKYEEENGESATLAGFLEEVALMTDIDNYDAQSDSVIMMTIHAAKGLEFPVVFLPGMEDGVFPGMQSMYNTEAMEEERRLAYVAITRAKEQLYMIHAQSRMLYGSTSRNRLSQFAREIPDELLEVTAIKRYYREESEEELKAPPSWQEKKAQSQAAQQRGVSLGMSGAGAKTQSASYKAGETVEHSVFGTGVIMSASPMGNDTMLEIAFDKVGTKKVMANFAKLKKG
ncbi:MAG: UvrD-helicase domain-containing protein [Oscillospiraceae bacterium]|jgi:DNA helicase-2/ATP-dependent DNA helicase PcrA|nr:UvrD-helicase domain-containing protein [Oscillospiraceae bacterium]